MESIFNALFSAESDAIFRFCMIHVSDREQALDITQETFLRLWKKIQERTKIENARAFLYKVSHNLIIDWYRKKKSDSLDVLLENDDEGKAFEPADEKMHSNMVLSAEAKRVLLEIEKLEPIYRDVLSLRFTKDLTPQEIGEIIGENANTVSIRITRGLEKLKERFHTKI